MNIETVLTPNPETLKFMVDKTYIFQSGIEIKNEKEAKDIKDIMENCVELHVPSKVDTDMGESWGG